ncbi:MAG: O-antigen ligase family protein [Pseudomonadota bacterium]
MIIPKSIGGSNNPDSQSRDLPQKLEPYVNVVTCLILATSFLFWDISRAIYVLLSLASLLYIVVFRPKMPSDHKLYSWPIIIFLCTTVLSLLFHGFSDSGVNSVISRFFLLLLAIPIAVTSFITFDKSSNTWVKFSIACIIMGVIALIDSFYLDKTAANGGYNSAMFGMAALSMTAVAVASFHRCAELRWGKFLFTTSILLGLVAIILSASRTTWFSSVIIFLIAGYFLLDRYNLSKRFLIILLSLAAAATVAATQPKSQARFFNMIEIITPYLKGDEQTQHTSLRLRVEVWKMGWQIGMENKLIGYGPGETKRVIKHYATEYPQYHGLQSLRNFHNQFIQSFAMCGVPGLISYLLLVVCHFWLFFKYLNKQYNREVRMLALSGLLLVVTYLLKAFLGVSFYDKQQLLVYGIASATLWGSLSAAANKSLLSAKPSFG